jgi:glycosyltransferase involved in cell wall biosynthesis
MNIGIVSNCDISVFWDYLFEDNRPAEVFRESCAPSVNTFVLALLKAGHNVTIFTTHPSIENLCLKGPNLIIHVISSYDKYPAKYLYGSWLDAKKIKDVLSDHYLTLDLLHAQWTYEFAWAAGQFADKIPVFCSVRDWTPYVWKSVALKNKISWSFRWLINNNVFSNINIKFISNSPYTANRIKDKWGIVTPIIPNPIKKEFIITERHKYPDLFNIVSISQSIDKRKNIVVLLKAFQKFHRLYPCSSLSLIGGEFIEENQQVKQWATMGLLIGVKLVGHVRHSKLIDILDDASLLVHPALEETFGNTLIEAMARRVPVIGGIESGAVPYVLNYGKCGSLCDVSSKDDIVEKMVQIYCDKNFRDTLISNATNLLFSNYIDEEIVNKHLELYKKYK